MPYRTVLSLLFLLTALTLAGCSSGPVKRVFPPTASIQELIVQDNGQWLVSVRIQSFSNVPHTIASLDAKLTVDGIDAATLALSPDLTIGPQNAEIEPVEISPDAEAAARVIAALESGRRVEYTLHGSLNSSAPSKRQDTFSFDGQLWPMPGLPGVLR